MTRHRRGRAGTRIALPFVLAGLATLGAAPRRVTTELEPLLDLVERNQSIRLKCPDQRFGRGRVVVPLTSAGVRRCTECVGPPRFPCLEVKNDELVRPGKDYAATSERQRCP